MQKKTKTYTGNCEYISTPLVKYIIGLILIIIASHLQNIINFRVLNTSVWAPHAQTQMLTLSFMGSPCPSLLYFVYI